MLWLWRVCTDLPCRCNTHVQGWGRLFVSHSGCGKMHWMWEVWARVSCAQCGRRKDVSTGCICLPDQGQGDIATEYFRRRVHSHRTVCVKTERNSLRRSYEWWFYRGSLWNWESWRVIETSRLQVCAKRYGNLLRRGQATGERRKDCSIQRNTLPGRGT